VAMDAAKNLIVEEAYDKKYGARPLRRKIQDEIEDRIAEQMIKGEIKSGSHIIVTTKNKEIVVTKADV